MDANVIVLSNLVELWNTPFEHNKMVIAKGEISTARLCTCVWNCEVAKNYLPKLEHLKKDPRGHQSLMKFIQEKPYLVQNYTNSYNCIDGEDLLIDQIKILHYSDMGTQFSHKYAIPRLERNGQKHWFDGKIIEHPRDDLILLFDQYYQQAIDAGFRLTDYEIKNYGPFNKATQSNYHGNKVTRPIGKENWFKRSTNKFKEYFKKEKFSLDD